MNYSKDKSIQGLVEKYVSAGWTFSRQRKHGLLTSPGGRERCSIPLTPKDHRAFDNLKAQLKRLASREVAA